MVLSVLMVLLGLVLLLPAGMVTFSLVGWVVWQFLSGAVPEWVETVLIWVGCTVATGLGVLLICTGMGWL